MEGGESAAHATMPRPHRAPICRPRPHPTRNPMEGGESAAHATMPQPRRAPARRCADQAGHHGPRHQRRPHPQQPPHPAAAGLHWCCEPLPGARLLATDGNAHVVDVGCCCCCCSWAASAWGNVMRVARTTTNASLLPRSSYAGGHSEGQGHGGGTEVRCMQGSNASQHHDARL